MKILTFVYTIDQAILYLNDFLNSNIFYFKLSLFSVSFFPFTLIFFTIGHKPQIIPLTISFKEKPSSMYVHVEDIYYEL